VRATSADFQIAALVSDCSTIPPIVPARRVLSGSRGGSTLHGEVGMNDEMRMVLAGGLCLILFLLIFALGQIQEIARALGH
jgi:hypothetical protein